MKRFVMALFLACALSGSALAGDVPSTGSPAPTPGDIHTVDAPGEIPSTGISVWLTVLDLAF